MHAAAASFTSRSRPLLTQHRRRGSTLGDAALPFRYYRLPLPVEGAPLEEDFDAFVNILRVSLSFDTFFKKIKSPRLINTKSTTEKFTIN